MPTCLIVDDSRVARTAARYIVEILGFDVCEAADGREALELCLAAAPDTILLDWTMPGMDGIDFLRALHGAGLSRLPKVVVCTATAGADIDAVDAGADYYITKPFDRATLEAKLRHVTTA